MNHEKGSYLFTSESVSEGHPDKVCDQISDAVLDACLSGDPKSRVACETAVTTGLIFICGEITTKSDLNFADIARKTVEEIGYTKPEYRFDSNSCGVIVSVGRQSPDIAMGVNETESHEQGAGDQGMMFGYACDETPERMPLAISLANKILVKAADLRKKGVYGWLRPDSKSQVTIEYVNNEPKRIHTVVVSHQHDPSVSQKEIADALIPNCIKEVLPKNLIDDKTIYHINPTGQFIIGGPHGDSGLTGRKIIVDTYGGYGRHGGGAFSGKDPSKVDRSAAYFMRYVAKNIVASGIARRCEVQVAYAIGVAKPVSVVVDTFGTGKITDEQLTDIVVKNIDMRPRAIIEKLNLLRPIFRKTAAYGHFGRTDADFTWEKEDLVPIFQKYM